MRQSISKQGQEGEKVKGLKHFYSFFNLVKANQKNYITHCAVKSEKEIPRKNFIFFVNVKNMIMKDQCYTEKSQKSVQVS